MSADRDPLPTRSTHAYLCPNCGRRVYIAERHHCPADTEPSRSNT